MWLKLQIKNKTSSGAELTPAVVNMEQVMYVTEVSQREDRSGGAKLIFSDHSAVLTVESKDKIFAELTNELARAYRAPEPKDP